jgi:hypothetical protein
MRSHLADRPDDDGGLLKRKALAYAILAATDLSIGQIAQAAICMTISPAVRP